MGIAIPQVITSDRATGAQVIDGSLGFSGTDQKLERTPGSAGNQQTWTWSSWVKIQPDQMNSVFSVYTGNSDRLHLRIGNSYAILAQNTGSWDFDIRSNAKFRDNEWYHFVCVADFTNSTQNDRAILYVNGERLTLGTNTLPSNTTTNTIINATKKHYIGESYSGTDFEGRMSQVYFIDGQALGPEYFGYTDGLTNTWKPKKYDTEAPTNNPNNNTTWSSNVSASSGSFGSGEEATKGFDGNTSTKCKTDTNGASITITFSGLTVQKLLRIRTNYTNGSGSDIEVNDVSYGAAATASDGEYKTISGFTGALTKIKLEAGASVNAAFSAIEVDGVILQDSTTTNNRTWDSSVTFGTNGFYLPMDGNSPIGQDQSGQGNNWTPVNFGGSVALDSPLVSGARPILNTTQGGSQAGVGVFGSKQNVGYAVTYYDDGGGNKYYIDGVKQATLTGLIRGATYTFNTVALGSTHPFRFSDSDGGSEYTNGVAAITGTATTITIPHDAPNELYYYCTQHTGMGSSITGITTNEKLADQYASHCVLAVPLVGGAGNVSASIACTSTKHSMTVSGAAADSSESNFYSGSFVFDGSNDTVYTASNSSEFSFGSGDFTIEAWVNSDSSASKSIVSLWAYNDSRRSWNLYLNGSQQVVLITSTDGSNQSDVVGPTANTALPANKWTHVAVTKESNTYRCFIDGDLKESNSVTETLYNNTNDEVYIGSTDNATEYYDGHIQDVRIYKGVAKYTSNFVVPSRSPDILPDTPSGVAGGSKLTKITDGAVSFDGSGDYLSIGGGTDMQLGTGDFTIETFAYFKSISSGQIYEGRPNGTQGAYISIYFDSGLVFYTNSAARITASNIVRNKWHHIALVRESSTTKLYVDGISAGSYSDTSDYTVRDDGPLIGVSRNSSNNPLNGFLSNYRIVKGTALYTSDFTPPTEPLTNVTNTKLLCCQSNTSATNAVVVPPNEPFSGAGGAQGRGTTSDFLRVDEDSDLSLDGDFTVEWWHYRADTSSNNGFMWTIGDSQTSTGIELYWGTSGTKLNLYTNDGSNLSSATAATGWHHYAVVRNGTGSANITVYYDGTSVHTITNNNTFSGDVTIGGEYYGGNITGGMHGPMSQFRLVKGTAVYTSNFTAPTTALTAITNTKILTLQGDTITDASGTNKVIQVFGNVNTDDITARGDVEGTNSNPFNTDIHAVRGQETGYATLNPLINGASTLSDGNLTATAPSGSTHGTGRSTLTMDTSGTGKFYFEATLIVTGGTYPHIGVLDSIRNTDAAQVGSTTNCFSYFSTGNVQLEGASGVSYGDSFTVGDTIGCSLDCGSGELRFYKNGVDQGVAKTITANYHACFAVSNFGSSGQWKVNFGQKPFKFPPPDGFQPLNAANTRPETVIARPDQYVGIVTYASDGNARTISGLNFQPDLVWQKQTTSGDSDRHFLTDSVRGAGTALRSDTTAIDAASDAVESFTSDGWNITAGSGNANQNTKSYVAWAWKAGGSCGGQSFWKDDVGYASASAAGLTAGDTTPTGASVGTKQGFSIIKYTGPNDTNNHEVPHGLSQAPDFILAKNLDITYNWDIYHSSLADDAYLIFTNAATRAQGFSGRPTSTVFKTEHNYSTNENEDYIAYCWHNVPGLQKFGVYTGNENTGGDGPFVELGFRPAIIWIKNTDQGTSAADWVIYDSERNKFNPSGKQLYPNRNIAEADDSNHQFDILSNGFKVRSTSTSDLTNATDEYIYCAWAEAPSIDLFGGGANAR